MLYTSAESSIIIEIEYSIILLYEPKSDYQSIWDVPKSKV